MTIFSGFILGLIQGLAEWVPISSEAMVNLVAINFFNIDAATSIELALMLHAGTLLSAIIYFRSHIKELLANPRHHLPEWKFYIISTVISIFLGGVIYLGLKQVVVSESGGAIVTLIMAGALFLTAWLLSRRGDGLKEIDNVSTADAVVLGITQGLAVIPGISRSGSTTALALMREFKSEVALRLSFMMGIPMIAIGSALLLFDSENLENIFSVPFLVALISAFLFGLLSIAALMKIAARISFVKFVLAIAVLAFIAGIMSLF
jgi:undecaprenyl-diphosphatase